MIWPSDLLSDHFFPCYSLHMLDNLWPCAFALAVPFAWRVLPQTSTRLFHPVYFCLNLIFRVRPILITLILHCACLVQLPPFTQFYSLPNLSPYLHNLLTLFVCPTLLHARLLSVSFISIPTIRNNACIN